MSQIRIYPAYTSVETVKLELPRFDSEELSDEQILQFIETEANDVDGRLVRVYRVPAPKRNAEGITVPETAPGYFPTQFERLNRLKAAADCMTILRDIRRDEQSVKTKFEEQYEQLLKELMDGTVIAHYPFPHPRDGRPFFLELAQGSPIYGLHPLSAQTRVNYSYPARAFTEGAQTITGRRKALGGVFGDGDL